MEQKQTTQVVTRGSPLRGFPTATESMLAQNAAHPSDTSSNTCVTVFEVTAIFYFAFGALLLRL